MNSDVNIERWQRLSDIAVSAHVMTDAFDYLVVARARGCVLAARLSGGSQELGVLLEAGWRDRHAVIRFPPPSVRQSDDRT